MRPAHRPRVPASPRSRPWPECAGCAGHKAADTPGRRTGPSSLSGYSTACARAGGGAAGASHSGLSACIITFNEADRIEACLRSVSFCDEIIVVDAHSTDGTRALAAALGARIIERDWPGYRSQKQFAVDAARHDWVLCLDADERVG